jgi:hypothetical protein
MYAMQALVATINLNESMEGYIDHQKNSLNFVYKSA